MAGGGANLRAVRAAIPGLGGRSSCTEGLQGMWDQDHPGPGLRFSRGRKEQCANRLSVVSTVDWRAKGDPKASMVSPPNLKLRDIVHHL